MNTAFSKKIHSKAFSKSSVFGDRKRRLRVDANPKRIKKDAFSKISGYAWTGPKGVVNAQLAAGKFTEATFG